MVVGGAGNARNVISGNAARGLDFLNNAADVLNNYIGVGADGSSAVGNGGAGIYCDSSQPGSIGGDNLGNVIANNGGDGIALITTTELSQQILISQNSIHHNAGLGIDLGDDGVTLNDTGDTDTGANAPEELQNYPVLTSVSSKGTSTTITGSLNSVPNTQFQVEFFSSPAGDPEGQTYLGSVSVTTDASGNAAIKAVVPVGVSVGQDMVTATAIDPSNNTSEFSMPLSVSGSASQLLNIATRLRVQSGENVLIGGFIITGTDAKKVVIRGIGPSLASFFNGVLENPTLELYQGNTLLDQNDDWIENRAEIEATGIPPTNDLEAAIVRTLPPGGYTAILRGKDDTIGIGLVETYDLDQAANSKLANIATRGFVETDNNVMIGGLIVGPMGALDAGVVVRAIGPSLSKFGINGALQNPTLDLVNSSGVVIQSNDDWKSGQRAELEALGLQPSDDRESALLQILAPGNYTAIVRGKDNTTGVGLVEVYNLE